jgi:hypothetical protein
LSYSAKVRPLGAAPEVPAPLLGGESPSLPLSRFYGGITFHGTLLQGITAIDGVGPDFVRGRVKTSTPAAWVRADALVGQTRWQIDPLAFDSAMQLAAYVAWVRYQRAGTPVGFSRWVQLREWPAGEVIAEARFAAEDSDRLEADLVFRTTSGEVIALALNGAKRTRGWFDPTWAALREVWKFGSAEDGRVPTKAEVAAKCALVSYEKVKLAPRPDGSCTAGGHAPWPRRAGGRVGRRMTHST